MGSIERTKLYEKVISAILEMITREQMQRGDKLPSEKEMCEMFGVSRMAMREALSVLQSRDLIEVRHGSGAFLKDINEKLIAPININLRSGREQIFYLAELRKGVESEAAYLAASRAEESDIRNLLQILEDMRQDIYTEEGASKEDYQFHCAVIEAAHNPIYKKVFNDFIADNFFKVLNSSHPIFSRTLGPRLIVIDEHVEIVENIMHHRPEAARLSMWKHIDSVELKLRKILS